jgi:hypothetical protein
MGNISVNGVMIRYSSVNIAGIPAKKLANPLTN